MEGGSREWGSNTVCVWEERKGRREGGGEGGREGREGGMVLNQTSEQMPCLVTAVMVASSPHDCLVRPDMQAACLYHDIHQRAREWKKMARQPTDANLHLIPVETNKLLSTLLLLTATHLPPAIRHTATHLTAHDGCILWVLCMCTLSITMQGPFTNK